VTTTSKVKPEIVLCETVLNLSMLNTLTYLVTNLVTAHVTSLFSYHKMVFTKEDKVAITFLRKTKRCGAKRLLAEFPSKKCSLGGLNKLL